MLLARFSKAPQTMSSNKDRTKQIEKLLQQFEDAGADKRPKVDKVKITRKRARVMHQGSERSERSNQIEGATNLLSLADELEAFIQSVVPGSVSVNKYGGRLFTLKPEEKEGQFCGVFIYKAHVQISFSKGAHITDEKNILLGDGKLRRHVNFNSIDDVDDSDLSKLLVEASKI